MIKKINNTWWIFTILSFICAYLNPYFGLFSLVMIIVLIFDIVIYYILKGHYNIFKKNILNNIEQISNAQKIFYKELLMFKLLKLFTTIFTIYVVIAMVVKNTEYQKILAPFYIPVVQENFSLQLVFIILALASIVFSCILFWSYANSYKSMLDEMG